MKQTNFVNPTFKWFQHVIFNEPLMNKDEELIQNWNLSFAKFYHQIINPVFLIKSFINSIELFYGFPNKNRIISDLNLLFFPISILDDKRNIKEWKFENFSFPISTTENIIKNNLNLKKILNFHNKFSTEFYKIISNFESNVVKFKKSKKQKKSIPFIKRIKIEKNKEKIEILYSRDENLISLDDLCLQLTEKIGLSEREWKNIFSQKEENHNEKWNEKKKFINDNLSMNSNWIEFMKILLTINTSKLIEKSTLESLEILNYFRSKLIHLDFYEVSIDFLKTLSEDEIFLISNSIHQLNIFLEQDGGIFYYFGRCLIEDLKINQILLTKYRKLNFDFL